MGKNGALMKEYPIHKGEEKANWDTVTIGKGKELSLFPFTKRAITNLYMCILQPDYRTPRYLLRDIIERAMRNYLFKRIVSQNLQSRESMIFHLKASM